MLNKAITEKIDFSKSEQYTLSIRLSADGFSFSVYSPISGGSLAYVPREVNLNSSLSVSLKEAIKELAFLSFPYKRVNVLFVTRRFTLIPMELYEDEQAEAFFYHNFSRQENEHIFCNVLKKANAVSVFSIDKNIHLQLTELFASASFYVHTTPLIEYFMEQSCVGNSNKMYVCLREKGMDVLCLDRGKLLFVNSFLCSSTDDKMYYLLYVWKQMNLNQERDEVHLSGWMEGRMQLISSLRKYINNVFLINPKAELTGLGIAEVEDMPFDLQVLLDL